MDPEEERLENYEGSGRAWSRERLRWVQTCACSEVGQGKGEVTCLRSLARKGQGWDSHGGGGSGLSPQRKEPVIIVTFDLGTPRPQRM